jgi:hypothetical protein
MSENKTGAIIKAVAKAMGEMKRIAKDSRNAEQKYDFASVDDFLAMTGPVCAANGIVTLLNEVSVTDFERQGKFNASNWLRITFEIYTMHESGESLPPVQRTVEVIRTGAQSFGSAQSYVLKQYQRALYQIPTGDKDDADFAEKGEGHVIRRDAGDAPPAFDPASHIAAIEAATTGKALLEAITPLGARNDHPAIAAARVDRLTTLIRGAQTAAALDAFKANFGPDWAAVKGEADARAKELTPKDADLGKDEIPY